MGGHKPSKKRSQRIRVKATRPEPTGNAPRTTGGHWVKELTNQRERFKLYRRTKTLTILPECPEARFCMDALPTLGTLLAATDEAVRTLPGFGPKRRASVHSYLSALGLSPKWTA